MQQAVHVRDDDPKGNNPSHLLYFLGVFSRSELQGIKAYAAQHRPDIPHTSSLHTFQPLFNLNSRENSLRRVE